MATKTTRQQTPTQGRKIAASSDLAPFYAIAGLTDILVTELRDRVAAGQAAAVLSEPLLLQELAGNLALLRRAVRQAPAGRLSAVSASYDARAKGWVGLLTSYNRADLLATVTSYLRHRGRWEDTARDLGLHRNSLRHRISLAQTRLDVSLDDPDVAAHLWLALQDADTA